MRTLVAFAFLALAPLSAAQSVVLFQDDFEAGLSNWTAEQIWRLQDLNDVCSSLAAPFPSGTKCVWFGNPTWCAIGDPNLVFGGGPWWDGNLTAVAPLALPAGPETIRLSFRSTSQAEDDEVWDRRTVSVLVDETGNWISLGNLVSSPWQTQAFDLTRWAGHTVRVRLEFWTGDSWGNGGFGWFVDDIVIETITDPAIAFCSGDGTNGACPCNNVSAPGRGCPSSIAPQGALLSASGSPSLTTDTLVLQASDVSQSAVTFFSTLGHYTFGSIHEFGDGMRCVTGVGVRARAFPNTSGVAVIPIAGDVPLAQRFGVTAQTPTRYVQAFYRNSAPFCTPATFNLTNGVMVTWRP